MKKLFTIVLAISGIGWLGYQIAMSTEAGQNFLLDRAFKVALSPAGTEVVDGLEVMVCGSSSPLPDPARAQACILVRAGDQVFIVDAGAGSPKVLQLQQAPMALLKGVLLTHFHSDHIAALGDINLGSWVAGRPEPLVVFGPAGVDDVVQGFNQAYGHDRTYRWTHHGEDFLPPALGVMHPRTIEAGQFYDVDGLRITAALVDHSPVAPAMAYRFDYRGRSVVISGDTVTLDAMAVLAQDADLLLHDALSRRLVTGMRDAAAAAGLERPAHIFSDILDYHAHADEIVPMAQSAGVEVVAFYHMVPPPRNELLAAVFSREAGGEVIITHDGMRFVMPAQSDAVEVID